MNLCNVVDKKIKIIKIKIKIKKILPEDLRPTILL